MLMDISDFDGLSQIKENYLATNKELEYVPQEGIYAVPYMANANVRIILPDKSGFQNYHGVIG